MNTTVDKKLTVESMKDMTIDRIIELYNDGYRIENLQTCEDLGCVSQTRLDDANKLIVSMGSSGVILTVLAIVGMTVSYMAGRESYKEKMDKTRDIIRKDYPEIYAKIF